MLTAGLFGLQTCLVAPASAAIEIQAANAPVPPSFVSDNDTASRSGCPNPIVPALASPGAEIAGSASGKAAAILGGRTSRLELIAMQQDASQATVAIKDQAPAGLPGKGLEPAAGGTRCVNFAGATLSPALSVQGIGRTPLGRDDFLASKRLLIGRTSFDQDWSRVRHSSLPQSMARRIANPGGNGMTREMIGAINAWTNRNVRYVEDRELYGRSDYWASARTTLRRRAGDCEDIAIAKMQLLAALGVPRSDMYLSIARDLARNADHAMLVVHFEGKYFLLDNATDQLLDASYNYDYRPIMSFNTKAKWLHGY